MTAKALVIRHHREDHPGLVGEAFLSRGFELEVVMMDETSPTPSVEGFDVLVILGSTYSVYDEQIEAVWFGRELAVIAEAERCGVAVLGICFGAQALCCYYGGVVERSQNPEAGWFEIEAVNDSGLGTGPWFEFHLDHCLLPAEAALWAKSPVAVQAFAVGRNVGVQFHPEIEEDPLAGWFASGDVDNALALLGIDPVLLLAQTAREMPLARVRALELVDLFLGHIGR